MTLAQAVSLPQYCPSQRELDDVELLRTGTLAPLISFGGPDDDLTLSAPRELVEWARERGGLEIVDHEGVPLAVVGVEATYPVHKSRVDFYQPDLIGVSGRVTARPGGVSRAFGDLYVAPSETRLGMAAATVTAGVMAPMSIDDIAAVHEAAGDRPVLFVVLTGHGTPMGVTAHGLIRTTLAAAERFPGSRVVAVPAARRPAGGDDHRFRRIVVAAFAPGEDLVWQPCHGPLPDDIAAIVADDRPAGVEQGFVTFFTGLSGSGKSTIAQAMRDRLQETGVRRVSLLDGDRVRRNLSRGLTFSVADRQINIERIAWVAAEIARHGGAAICSPIAPFDATRKLARSLAEEAGGSFVLIHMSTPLEVCERRDRKGLYAKARRGEIEQFTAITSPYEQPEDADLRIDTTDLTVDEALATLLEHLVGRGLLPPAVLSGRQRTN